MTQFVAVLCVLGIAVGQVLFKMGADASQRSGGFLAPQPALILALALALYGLTTIGWVWVLRGAELGRVYPFMALAFVLVPLASHFVFGERFGPYYFLGVALIAIGIVFAVRS